MAEMQPLLFNVQINFGNLFIQLFHDLIGNVDGFGRNNDHLLFNENGLIVALIGDITNDFCNFIPKFGQAFGKRFLKRAFTLN